MNIQTARTILSIFYAFIRHIHLVHPVFVLIEALTHTSLKPQSSSKAFLHLARIASVSRFMMALWLDLCIRSEALLNLSSVQYIILNVKRITLI